MRCRDAIKSSTPWPTAEDLARAREAFEANEPRDLFYRVATELVALTLDRKISLTVAEAVAVLLQTWNATYYQYRKGHFDKRHFEEIESLLGAHEDEVCSLRAKHLNAASSSNLDLLTDLFRDFARVLGPVGAAKCLHLLAPDLFPLWDNKIAAHYGLGLSGYGDSAKKYRRFMEITAEQCRRLGSDAFASRNPLKALDEYNYCRFTKRWI